MCRNYDAGECVEHGCVNRITCHDFMDNRCREHSINGNVTLYDEDEDEDEDETLADPLGVDVLDDPAVLDAADAWAR